jgi:hypothetical protein
MEEIQKLVDDSLARHGITPGLKHARLDWSGWFPCESSVGMLLAPAKPGIFALGEEIVPAAGPGSKPAEGEARGRRMLALFQISEADDLGMALGRLFLPGNPARQRLKSGRCFARYAVIENPVERFRAQRIFMRWIPGSKETASAVNHEPSSPDVVTPLDRAERSSPWQATGSLVDFPRGAPDDDSVAPDFLALGADRQSRESSGTACALPMPSGF